MEIVDVGVRAEALLGFLDKLRNVRGAIGDLENGGGLW
jgi:hypothetical protein